jgi:hypothetical protein
MALGRIGHALTTVALIDADTDPDAKQCNLHYEQTRDALLRSHWWRIARASIRLVSAWATSTVYTTDQYVSNSSVWYKCATAHTSAAATEPPHANWTTLVAADYTPKIEWDYMWDLPADWLADRYTYDDNDAHRSIYSYAVDGSKYYTDESAVDYVYTKKVTAVTDFDPLFIEVLVLSLALKLVLPLAQDKELYTNLKEEMYGRKGLMSKVRAMDRQEQNTMGIYDKNTWLASFRTSRDPTKLGGA